jgi:hypothetical protein
MDDLFKTQAPDYSSRIDELENQSRSLAGLPALDDYDRLVEKLRNSGAIPGAQSQAFHDYLANQEDPNAALAKLNAATFYAQRLDMSVPEAMANYDSIQKAWWGQARSPLTDWDAIKDQFTTARLSQDLGAYWAKARDEGMTPELQQQIDEVEAQMPPPDRIQRGLPATILKAAAGAIPAVIGFTPGALAGGAVKGLVLSAFPEASLLAGALAFGAQTVTNLAAMKGATGGLEYREMVKAGINPAFAATASRWSGFLQDSLMSDVVKAKLPSTLAQKTLYGAMEKMVNAGVLKGTVRNPIIKFALRQGTQSISMGADMALMRGISEGVYEAVREASNAYKGTDVEPRQWHEVGQAIVDSFVSGAMASIPLTALREPMAIAHDVVSYGDWKATEAARKYHEAATAAAAAVASQPGASPAEGALPQPASPVTWRESASATPAADGSIVSRLLGSPDPQAKKASVQADYLWNPDTKTVTIDALKIDKALSKEKPGEAMAQMAAALFELRRKYQGSTIEWEPATKTQVLLQTQLEAAHPGFFTAEHEATAAEAVASSNRAKFVSALKDKGGFDEETANVLASYLDARAAKMRLKDPSMTTDRFIETYVHPDMVKGELSPRGEAAAKAGAIEGVPYAQASFWKNGEEIPATSVMQDAADAKVLFHFVKKGDVSAAVHEFVGHGLIHTLDAEERALFEKAYGKPMEAWDKADHELAATDFEKYAETGVAPTKELEPLYKRIAALIKDTIAGWIHDKELSPDVMKAWDNVFALAPGKGETFKVEGRHGTKHEIKGRLSLKKAGSGEGGASFGHGLYITEHSDDGSMVARGYAKLTANAYDAEYTAGGEPVTGNNKTVATLKETGKSQAEAIAKLEGYAKGQPERWNDALRFARERWDEIERVPDRRVYDTVIEDPRGERFLELDKKVPDDQLDLILKEAGLTREDLKDASLRPGEDARSLRYNLARFEAGNIRLKHPSHGNPLDPHSGMTLYLGIAKALGSQAAASEFLDRAGFTGNTYIGDHAKSDGRGVRDWVVFNDAYVHEPKLAELFKTGDENDLEKHVVGAERGERTTSTRAILSEDEKAKVKEGATLSGRAGKEIASELRSIKMNHPLGDGWAPLEYMGERKVEGPNGKVKYEHKWKAIPYSFQKADRKSVIRGIVDEVRGIVDRAKGGDESAKSIIRQAGWYAEMRSALRHEFGGAGDVFADLLGATSPNTPVPNNWAFAVDVMRKASRGDFDELMPKWLEHMDRYEVLEKQANDWYDAQRAAGRTVDDIKGSPEFKNWKTELTAARKLPKELMPLQDSGKKYGFNGFNVVRALTGTWRVINEGKPLGRGLSAPKAFNFSGNLIGYRTGSTIDVWAARFLQRLAGARRVPPVAEQAVKGKMRPDGSTLGQFGYGQDVMHEAAKLIRKDTSLHFDERLQRLNDDDLQALVWFLEKEVWTRNNWTSGAGEGGSFEFENELTGTRPELKDQIASLRKIINSTKSKPEEKIAAAQELGKIRHKPERWYQGLSITKSLFTQGVDWVPEDSDMAVIARRMHNAVYSLANDAKVISAKFFSTLGRYGGDERSLDGEITVTDGFDPRPFARETFQIAKEHDQDATFVTRVLRQDEENGIDPLIHRPSIEIYFREAAPLERLDTILEAMKKEGLEGYTFSVDDRRLPEALAGKMPAVVGVRAQLIPEYDMRWGIESSPFGKIKDLSALSDDDIRSMMMAEADRLNEVALRIRENVEGVTSAETHWCETDVRFKGEYEGAIDDASRVPQGTDSAAGSQVWKGRTVRSGLEGAARRTREFDAESAARQSGDLSRGLQERPLDAQGDGLAAPRGDQPPLADQHGGEPRAGGGPEGSIPRVGEELGVATGRDEPGARGGSEGTGQAESPREVRGPDLTFSGADRDVHDAARDFKSYKDFKDAYEASHPRVEGTLPEEREAYLRQVWLASHPERPKEAPIVSAKEADSRFVDSLKKDGYQGLEDFLGALGTLIQTGARGGKKGLDPVEAAALRVADGKPLSDTGLKTVFEAIRRDAPTYRARFAQVSGDHAMRAQLEAERSGEAPTPAPSFGPLDSKVTLRNAMSRLRQSAAELSDPELRELYEDGKVAYGTALDEAKASKAEIAQLENELALQKDALAGWRERFTYGERKIAERNAELRDAKAELKKAAALAKYQKTDEAAARVEDAQARVDALRAEVKSRIARLPAGAVIKDTSYTAAREAAKEARATLEAKYAEAKAKMAAKDTAIALAKKILAPVSKSTDWRIAQEIRAIQKTIDPHFRRQVVEYSTEDLRKLFGETPNIDKLLPKEMVDRLRTRPLNKWTIGELQDLAKKVDSLRELGRIKLAERNFEKKQARLDKQDMLQKQLRESGKYEPSAMTGSQEFEAQKDKEQNLLKKWDHSLTTMGRLMRTMDNHKEKGWWYGTFVENERDCYRKQSDSFHRRWGAVEKKMDELGIEPEDLYAQQVKVGDFTVSKADAIGLYIGLQDADTAAKIAYGNMLNEDQRKTLPRAELERLGAENLERAREAAQSLSAPERELAQFLIDDGDREFSRLSEACYQYENREPPKVAIYFPNEVRGRSGEDKLVSQMREDLLGRTPRLGKGVPNGNTIARVKISPENQLPINLDALGVYKRGIEKQEHYIAYADYVKEKKLLIQNDHTASQLRYLVRQTHGQGALDYIDGWLEEVANPKAYTDYDKNLSGFEQVFRTLRGPLGTAYLGLRASSAIRQLITSPIPYFPYAGAAMIPAMLRNLNLAEYLRQAKLVKEKSAFIRDRQMSPTVAAIKEYAQSDTISKPMKLAARYSLAMIEAADMWSVVSGWTAVYDKTLAELSKSGGMDAAAMEQAAIKEADRITIESQPTGRRADVSPAFKSHSEIQKFLLQFQSPLNVVYNQLFHDVPADIAEGRIGRAAAIVGGYLATGAILGLIAAPRSDDDDAVKKLRDALGGALRQPFDAIPLAGGYAGDFLESGVTGNRRFRGSEDTFPAIGKIFSGTGGVMTAKDSEAFWKALMTFAEGSGMLAGIPTSALKEYYRTLFEGDPEALLGRPKK